MNILIGVASPVTEGELEQLAEAGAEEFFCGVMPAEWVDRYDYPVSLNRREFPGNHFDSFEELAGAVKIIHRLGKRVFVTFNAHSYSAEQFPLVRECLVRTAEAGADAIIASDVAVILEMNALGLETEIHVSGEAGCHNADVARFFRELGARRIILPRHLALEEIESIIRGAGTDGGRALEFEAFIMGQRCPYSTDNCTATHGWLSPNYCQSLFTDSLRPVLPPSALDDLRRIPPHRRHLQDRETRELVDRHKLDRRDFTDWSVNHAEYQAWKFSFHSEAYHDATAYLIQACGLCAIPHLVRMGVCSLKVVSRGDTIPSIIERIGLVRRVLEAGEEATPAFCRKVLNAPGMCEEGYRCYYRDAARGVFPAGAGTGGGE